jgi:hypothetical protein
MIVPQNRPAFQQQSRKTQAPYSSTREKKFRHEMKARIENHEHNTQPNAVDERKQERTKENGQNMQRK